MRKVAVLIAVEQYRDHRIPPVTYAEADARDLSAALQHHGFVQSEQILLINDEATKTTIQSHVRRILDGLTKEDVVYMFFAGHGIAKNGKNYITCFDTSIDDLAGTSISVQWLFRKFKESECERITMFLDSCESGALAHADLRTIYTDLTEDELRAYFDSAEHCVCFAACKPGESSYPAARLGHGIWSFHLIEALNAKAPSALEQGHLLTASSLQTYLRREVPRTLRKERTGVVVQTPWMYGAQSGEFLVADVSSILAKRKAAANPGARQLRQARLIDERSVPVRQLSGFLKGHRVPDRVNDATRGFVSGIAERDVNDDIEKVRNALRNVFGLKRQDVEAVASHGNGSIITPYFDYEVTVDLDADDPSTAVFRRQIHNIRGPEIVLSDHFKKVFSRTFDTLEYSTADLVDIAGVVDQIEDLDDDKVTVDYGKDLDWCAVTIEGIGSSIRITTRTVSVIRPQRVSPKVLIDDFFKIQKELVDARQMKQLTFERVRKKKQSR